MKPLLLTLLLVFFVSSATAQPTIFIVRHAEKAANGGKDPDLSEAGRARAEALATILKDEKITAIYATEFKRTQETATPLAQIQGIKTTIVPAASVTTPSFIEKLKESSGNVLVVGHGDTIPSLLTVLGLADPINIGENEYDNLFIVTLGQKPQFIRLHLP